MATNKHLKTFYKGVAWAPGHSVKPGHEAKAAAKAGLAMASSATSGVLIGRGAVNMLHGGSPAQYLAGTGLLLGTGIAHGKAARQHYTINPPSKKKNTSGYYTRTRKGKRQRVRKGRR